MATTVRDYLAEAIRAEVPASWKVKAYPSEPENVRRGTAVVSIWRTAIQPATGTDLTLDHPVTINIYGARTTDEDLETELEGNHDLVFLALQKLAPFHWLRSERLVWRDGTIAGWQITGTVSSPNIYRAQANKQ